MIISAFPHLRVGTFIEARQAASTPETSQQFPHLRVGTFIEAMMTAPRRFALKFPHLRVGTFIEAVPQMTVTGSRMPISPPSGGDFH